MNVTKRPDIYTDLEYLGAATDYVEDVFEAISNGPLFGSFSQNEIEALCQFMHCFVAPREGVLLNEGEQGDYLLVILSGNVDVRKKNPQGKLVTIAQVHRGSSLGEMSLFDGSPRFATCVATEPVDFAVMTRADFNEILLIHPRLANKLMIRLMQVLVVRLRDTGQRLLSNYLNPVKD